MAFAGSFVLTSNENYDAFLKSIGLSADTAAKVCAAKPQLEVSGDATGVTVKTTSGENVFSNSIVFGKDSEASIATLKYTLNVVKSDTGYTGTIKVAGKSGTVSVVATDTGFTRTTTVDGITAKRIYARK